MEFLQFVSHHHQPESSSTSATPDAFPFLLDQTFGTDGHNVARIGELEKTISRNSLISTSDSGTGTWSDQEEGEEERKTPLGMKQRRGGREEGRAKRPNRCAVCGRAAICCHFDVPSCLGCRSFFRRSVLCQRQYICHRGGECRLDQGEICRSCRFDQCILAGMNPHSIQTQSNKVDMDGAIAFLERKRMELHKRTTTKEDDQNGGGGAMQFEPALECRLESQLLESLLYADDKILRIRYSETEVTADFYREKGLFDILQEDQNILANADKFSNRRRMAKSLEYHSDQIRQGNIAHVEPNWLFIDCYLCFEFVKTLPSIRQLPFEDQITLIANNTLAAVVFSQSFYSIEVSGLEVITFPNGFSPLCFTHNDEIAQTKRKLFSKNLRPYQRIGLSREEFVLLRTILLLQTAAANLSKSACSTLQAEQEKYSKALMRFERCRLGDVGGAQRFAELMFFNNSIRQIGNEHHSFLTYVTTVLDACRVFPHPDYMDNVIFGIVGKIRHKKRQPLKMSEQEIIDFIRQQF